LPPVAFAAASDNEPSLGQTIDYAGDGSLAELHSSRYCARGGLAMACDVLQHQKL
jgi:hypothetical protein